MAELALSAVGLAGLSGLFNSAVACFEHVTIAKTFDQDLAMAQLRLDSAAFRLSRWGTAMNMNSTEKKLPEADLAHAEQTLRMMLWLFERGQEKSELFSNGRSTASFEIRNNTWPIQHFVHVWMVTKTQSRVDQRKTRLRERSKWVLYKKRELDGLIADIVELMGALEAILPNQSSSSTASNELHRIAQAEVDDICQAASGTDGPGFARVELAEALRSAAATGTDPYLEDSVKKLLKDIGAESSGEGGMKYTITLKFEAEIKDNRGIFAGVNHGSQTSHYTE